MVTVCPAYASAEQWAVSIDCPELNVEARAELEVRHLVELRAVPGEPATLLLRCTDNTVEGAWQRDGQTISRRFVTRTPGDKLLELAHWLASMLIGVVQADGVPMRVQDVKAQTTAPSAGAAGAALPVNAEPKPVAKPPPERSPAPAPAPARKSSQRASSPAFRLPWSLGLAASSHLFATEIPGSLGPSLHGTRSLSERFGVHAALGYEWSLGEVAGFSSQEAVAAAHLDTAVRPWLSVLVGPVLSVFRVKSEAHANDTRHSTTAGLDVLARVAAPWSGFGPFAQLGMRGLLRPREVRRGDEVVWSIPSWQAVLVIGAQFGGTPKK